MDKILTIEPKLGEDAFQMEDISDMVDSTCQLDEILSPSFFGRTPFPFRMLRLALELHLIDPIDNSKFLNVRMTDNEKRNQGLKQLIWFLLFLGATPDEISENLALYRRSRQDARASFSHGASSSRARTDNFRNIDETRTSITNLRNVPENIQFPAFEPQVMQSDARASHGNPSAPRPLMREQIPAQTQFAAQSSRTDDEQSHSKKGFAVHSYFKGRQFAGHPGQSIDNLLRDYRICAAQQCLNAGQLSLFFVNALADPAREHFLTHCSPTMPFEQIATHMRRHFNSETRKLQLQSEMDSLDIASFMNKNKITDQGEGLRRLVDHINALAPQLPAGFGDDQHKTRYLRRAVMRLGFAQQPISQLTSARYSFIQFTTALQESLQLSEELARIGAQDMHYGQYVRNPRDLRASNHWRSGQQFRQLHDRRDRSRSPYANRGHERSRSPARFNNQGTRSINPNVRNKRVCWGCGSPDHILSDRKCTPELQTIRTNITDCVSRGTVDEIAQQFLTLHGHTQEEDTDTTHVRQEGEQHVSFDESAYHIAEESFLQSQFNDNMNDEHYRINLVVAQPRTTRTYDCSHVHPLHPKSTPSTPGFCADIGAPKSVIGLPTLNNILRHTRKKSIPTLKSTHSYRFGDVTVHALGIVELVLKTPDSFPDINVLMDIVPVNVPALLGLNVLDAECLYADNVTNRLVHRQVLGKSNGVLNYKDKWSVPLMRIDNHLYAGMVFPHHLFYTTAQIHKLHRQFAHPSASKLFNLLKRAGTEAVDAKTFKQLTDIVARCEPCQRIHNAPVRFRVSMGHENVRFNARAYIDIMYLDGKPVLHIVDEATRFSAARFLTRVSTDSVWEALIMCWSSVYTGLPHNIMVDEGSQFRKLFAELSVLHEVNLEKSGVQSHHSLGIGERYHKPLRDTYRKLKLDHPSMQRQVLLALAVKAMNDTLGPEGIVPSSLVFGEFPSLRSFVGPAVPRPTLAERAEAAQEARQLMAKHLAQVRINRALKHNTPVATDRVFQPGDKVLLWREKVVENRIGEWVGPYTVKSFDENSRIVLVQKSEDAPHERYNITQVKHLLEPETASISFVDDVRRTFSVFSNKDRTFDTYLTEVVGKHDPRASSPEMKDAISNEVRDLLRRGTFKVILKEELSDGANALTARFVLAIKSNADGQIKHKARYVIGGHRDSLKQFMVHGAQTLQASSARLILALATMFEFHVWSSDVKLAYLQSTEPLTRRVFIKNPAPEFELRPEECFELLRPLYGLSDAGDLWHKTLHRHLVDELGLVPSKADPSLYFAFTDGTLSGINGSYVDDLLRAGTESFQEACKHTHRRFETSGDEIPPFTFAGFNISCSPDGFLSMDQLFYMKKLEEIDFSSSYSDFRSMRMKLAWLSNTRPDLQFEISQLAQVTSEQFETNAHAHLKRLNDAIRYAHVNVAHLKIPKLDRSTLRNVGYSDATFANNPDLTSQLGRIILLMDKTDSAIPVTFKSYKSRRVTRSVLSAEVIAFADLFDDAFALRSQMEQATNRAVPMHLMTDSKSLFDIISKGSRTSEKRIMLDIHSARQAYQAQEISNIGFVRSCDNLADGLTKGKKQKALLNLLLTGAHEVKCEQWILRK